MSVRLRGFAVRGILARRHLSQNELARLCGVSSGYMSQLMTGWRNPSPLMRQRLLSVLGEDRRFEELFVLNGRRGRD